MTPVKFASLLWSQISQGRRVNSDEVTTGFRGQVSGIGNHKLNQKDQTYQIDQIGEAVKGK